MHLFFVFIISIIYSIHLIHLGSRKIDKQLVNNLTQLILTDALTLLIEMELLAKSVSSIDIGINPADIIDEKNYY